MLGFGPPPLHSSVLDYLNLKGATVAVCVTDETGKVLLKRNSDLRVTPASNEKLATCAFVLYELGPEYRPVTSLWKLSDHTVVDSPGDPTLSGEKLQAAATSLSLNKKNPVYVHEAYAPVRPGTWEVGDLFNRYAATVTAFSADRGGFELWNSNGVPELRPQSFGVRIMRASYPKVDWSYDPFSKVVTLKGKLPNKTERLDTFSVPRADEAAAQWLGSCFLPVAQVPDRAPDLQLTGDSIQSTIGQCLRPSDNNIAEHLLLMAARHEGPLSEPVYEVATAKLKSFLERVVGSERDDMLPVDGSGLSTENLVTTRGLARLLWWESKQPTFGIWKNALAQPGSGTLVRRLKGISFAGKTGTLSQAAALSGYLKTKSGEERIVSIVVNHFAGPASDVEKAIDQFLEKLSAGES